MQLLKDLPKNVLGFTRSSGSEKLLILLNFDDQEKEFSIAATEYIFKLTPDSQWNEGIIRLDGYGGIILKHRPE